MISEERQTKHKGGRPKMSLKKESATGVRFTKPEYFIVKHKSQKAGSKISAYIRSMAREKYNWNGWIGGGWGGTSTMGSTTVAREGTKSIKIDYVGGYGSPLQLGGATISLSPYTTFKLSVYGAPGSGGKTITLGINGVNGKYNITVVEGKWTDYAIPISTLTSAVTLNEIWVQEYSGTGGFTVYVDALGLN